MLRRTLLRVPLLAISTLGCSNQVKQDRAPIEQASLLQGPGGAVAPTPSPKALREPEHAVFSLYDNRLLAHRQRGGGLLAAAGSGAFAKYVRFGRPKLGWKLRVERDGHRVAVLERDAAFQAPLTAAQARVGGALTLRLRAPKKTRLTVRINDRKPAITVEIASGWQTISVPLPAEALRAGENTVQLGTREALAVAWLQLGGTAPGTGTDESALPSLVDAEAHALRFARGEGLAYYVEIPAAGRLVGDVLGAGCEVTVSATAHEGAATTGTLRGAGGAVDLQALAGKVVRLELTGAGCAEARLTGAALATAGKAPVVDRGQAKPPRHVVLWVMDTLRVDRIPTFTPGARAETPTFDKLAAGGAVFLNAYAGGNESQASHATIFTGAWPASHNVIPMGGHPWQFKKGWKALGDVAKAAGLYGIGITGNGFVLKDAGYGRGLAVFKNLMNGEFSMMKNGYLDGATAYEQARKAADKVKDKPFFLFVGTVDTHVPLWAHEPWMTRYDSKPYKGKFQKVATAGGMNVSFMLSHKKVSDRDFERMQAIYDSDLSYQDMLVGKLLDDLQEWGMADDTMIIITADHGEEWWEDGRMGHGGSLRQALIHVPLLVYYPPLIPGGTRVEEGVEGTDIMATVADALGQPLPETVQGESLVALAHGAGRGYPRPQIGTMFENAWAMKLGRWKLRVGTRPLLYDLQTNPNEDQDLADTRPLERRFVTDALSTWLLHRFAWRKAVWGVASNMTDQGAIDLGE